MIHIIYDQMNVQNTAPCEMAEVVYEKPLSGEFEEVMFGSDKGNTLWVKFADKDGCNEWIGKFADGGQGSRCVTKIAEPDKFFVTAGRFAYLLDATNRKVLNQFDNGYGCDIAYDTKRNLVIVAGWTHLRWVEFGGKEIFSREVAVDGIRDLKVEGNILSGLAYKNYEGNQEEKFQFDLDGLKIISWKKVPLKNSHAKKSWWKFR